MTSSSLTFNNTLTSLKIPAIEECQFLLYQNNRRSTPEQSIADIEALTNDRLGLLFEIFKNLPNESVIIDIGAGSSLVDLALASLFPEKNFKFILVDSGEDDINNLQTLGTKSTHYNENGYGTYNNWSFVKKVIDLNKLPLDNFTFVHPNDFKECSADVVMSFSSWGWHYPLSTYLDIANAGLKKNGYISFMPLLNADHALDKLNDMFGRAVNFRVMQFEEDKFASPEKEFVLGQIQSGKLQRDPFAFHGIWQRRYRTHSYTRTRQPK